MERSLGSREGGRLSAKIVSTRYRAVVSYVGTHFAGWQTQRNAPRTVQAVLEDALGRVAGGPVRILAAGRTDAGVHADGQVAHFDLPRELAGVRVRAAVNSLLPGDVRLLAVDLARPDFHARRDAAWKEYVYRWSRSAVIPPREATFVATLAGRADAMRMREAASFLPGRRDFGVFAVRRLEGDSAVRTLHAVGIEEAGEEIRAVFRGDAFLRGMVRSICGVLADVGRGKVPVERLSRVLQTQDRRLLSPKAAAHGLTLVRVHYEE